MRHGTHHRGGALLGWAAVAAGLGGRLGRRENAIRCPGLSPAGWADHRPGRCHPAHLRRLSMSACIRSSIFIFRLTASNSSPAPWTGTRPL